MKKVSHLNEKTRTKIAKLHGTNATTVSDCEKILAGSTRARVSGELGGAWRVPPNFERRPSLYVERIGRLLSRNNTSTNKCCPDWPPARFARVSRPQTRIGLQAVRIGRRAFAFCAEYQMGRLLRESERAKGAKGNPGGRGARIVRSPQDTAHSNAPTLAEHAFG